MVGATGGGSTRAAPVVRSVLGAFVVKRARELFGDLDIALGSAVSHYMRRLRSGLESPVPPAALAEVLDPPLLEVEVKLFPSGTAVLEAESRWLGVEMELLLNHTVLVHLADLDRESRRPE
jgi:hypothetical protein